MPKTANVSGAFNFFNFFKLILFFMNTAPIDSMKKLRTPSRLRCSFDFFGQKKRISNSPNQNRSRIGSRAVQVKKSNFFCI